MLIIIGGAWIDLILFLFQMDQLFLTVKNPWQAVSIIRQFQNHFSKHLWKYIKNLRLKRRITFRDFAFSPGKKPSPVSSKGRTTKNQYVYLYGSYDS
jgi:hypothetical protein